MARCQLLGVRDPPELANALLFSVGSAELIDLDCQRAPPGALVDNALIVRRAVLGALGPAPHVR